MRDAVYNMLSDFVAATVNRFTSTETPKEDWDIEGLNRELDASLELTPVSADEVETSSQAELVELLQERAANAYADKEAEFEEEEIREVERVVLLKAIDRRWMDHIDDMDQLRQGIGLQSYGQKNPLVEYKMLGYDMFGEMTEGISADTVRMLMHVRVEKKVEREEVAKVTGTNKDESLARAPKKREDKKVYPNDPCPCGSGKKYKQCCGRK